jgi:hypothetical protein
LFEAFHLNHNLIEMKGSFYLKRLRCQWLANSFC